MIRLLSLVLLIAIAAPVAADEVKLPPGKVTGGFVENDGATVLLSGDSILRIAPGGKVETFETPDNIQVQTLQRLKDGQILLVGKKPGPPGDDMYTEPVRDIVKLRAGKVVSLWRWAQDCPEKHRDNHGCTLAGSSNPHFTADGKVWGDIWPAGRKGAAFTSGRTRKNGKPRTEIVEFDTPDMSESPIGAPYSFRFLDSEGQVIMVRWSAGAYIIHFSDDGSPYTVPILQDEATSRAINWQSDDRFLWTQRSSGGVWRAWHLWDLGLSGLPPEPFWEVEAKDGWRPYRRGVVRMVESDLGYRIEHLWREPWTGLEEYHVSGWQPGSPPSRHWVSPNGRHAAVLGTRQLEDEEGGGVAFSVRRVGMHWKPRPLPPIEAAEPPAADDAEPAKKQDPPAGR